MKRIVVLFVLLFLPSALLAQNPTAQREEMKKLGFLVGEWKGEGWIVTPDGKRREFIQTERVQPKLGGVGLMIEGQGVDKTSNTVAFEAAALVFYDERAKVYRIHSGTSDGHSGDGKIKLTEGGLTWGPDAAQGRVRYTIKMTDKGEWHEMGEFSPDGTAWTKFHEMTLRRTK